MIEIFLSIGWFVVGFSTMLYLLRNRNVTWGDLLCCFIIGGVGGPIIIIGILFGIFMSAEFWDKPVFPKKKVPPVDSGL